MKITTNISNTSEVASRVKEAIEFFKWDLKLKKMEDFAVKMEMPRTNFSSAINGNEKYLNNSFIDKFCDVFPDISHKWLLTGEGDMIFRDNNIKVGNITNTGGNVVAGNVGNVSVGGKSIDGETSRIDSDENYVISVPVSAVAGSLSGFSEQVGENHNFERIISPIKGADMAITVSGDSMYPEYPSGSKILIKKINEQAFIDWGRVYVLDTCNGVVIKKIMPSEDDKKVKCVSINEEYPPFEVSFKDIFSMYRVLLCMSIK